MKKVDLTPSTSVSIQSDNGRTTITVLGDPVQVIKEVLKAYGLYSNTEESDDYRVVLTKGERPALVLQENISQHGAPCWQNVKVLTEDPEAIEARKAALTLSWYMKTHIQS